MEKLLQDNKDDQQVHGINHQPRDGGREGGREKEREGGRCSSNHLGSAFHPFSMRSGTSLMPSTKG